MRCSIIILSFALAVLAAPVPQDQALALEKRFLRTLDGQTVHSRDAEPEAAFRDRINNARDASPEPAFRDRVNPREAEAEAAFRDRVNPREAEAAFRDRVNPREAEAAFRDRVNPRDASPEPAFRDRVNPREAEAEAAFRDRINPREAEAAFRDRVNPREAEAAFRDRVNPREAEAAFRDRVNNARDASPEPKYLNCGISRSIHPTRSEASARSVVDISLRDIYHSARGFKSAIVEALKGRGFNSANLLEPM